MLEINEISRGTERDGGVDPLEPQKKTQQTIDATRCTRFSKGLLLR